VGGEDFIVGRNSNGAKSFTATGVAVSHLVTMTYNTALLKPPWSQSKS